MTTHDSDVSVTAFVRPELLPSPIETKLDRLRDLEERDCVTSVAITHWPADVPMGEETPFEEVVETFERFEEWAAREGVDIQPPFEVRTIESVLLGASTRLRTPGLCLAIEVDGVLRGVFPHRAGADRYGADDAILLLERGEFARDAASDRAVAGARRR